MPAFPKQDVTSPARVLLKPDSYIPHPNFIIASGSVKFIPQAEFISLNAEAQSPTEPITSAMKIHLSNFSLQSYSQTESLPDRIFTNNKE